MSECCAGVWSRCPCGSCIVAVPVCMHVSRLTRVRIAVRTCQAPSTAASDIAASLALHAYPASWPVVLIAANGGSCQHAPVRLDQVNLLVCRARVFSAARGNTCSRWRGVCNIVCTSECALQSSGIETRSKASPRLHGANIGGC